MRPARRLPPLLLAALALWLGAPLVASWLDRSPSAFAQPGYSGYLAVGRPDGLWVLPLDGTPPRQLVAAGGGAFITGVSWSPSGQEIAYTRFSFEGGVVGGADLYLADLAGNARVLVARDDPDTLLGTPTWDPTGGSLLFDVTRLDPSATGGALRRIDRTSADGSARSVEVADGYAPSLSADGRSLAYLRQQPGGVEVRLRDRLAGTERVALPAGSASGIGPPSLSPDGSVVVFGAASGPGLIGSMARCPNLAHQAHWLAPIAAAHGLPEELWRVQADGSGLARLTSLCLDDPVVAWSADGAWLAAYGATGLVLFPAQGGAPLTIWTDGGYGGVDWLSERR